MRTRISKRTVDKLQPGQAIADLDVSGFTARCLPSGTICYDLRYRTATGERRRLSLGLHGAVTPDQARAIAEKRLDDLAKDRDPAIERQRQRTTTVDAVLDNYVARVLGTKRSSKAQISAFDRLVRPEIGTRSIYDLRRADIARLYISSKIAADQSRRIGRWRISARRFTGKSAVTTISYRRLFVAWRGPRQRNEHATAS